MVSGGKYAECIDYTSEETSNGTRYTLKLLTFSSGLSIGKGEVLYDYIISSNKEEFPENGEKDGYWYIKISN